MRNCEQQCWPRSSAGLRLPERKPSPSPPRESDRRKLLAARAADKSPREQRTRPPRLCSDYRCAPRAATQAATLLGLRQRLGLGFGLGIADGLSQHLA
jgi:hypothetical protein